MIAPSTMSQMSESETRSRRNSSGMIVHVALAALPMASVRCPVGRPIVTPKYQRPVVFASSIRRFTNSTPTCRAVSNPRVETESGSQRSLSIVFGTSATRIAPSVARSIAAELRTRSSPPIVTSASMLSLRSAATAFSKVAASRVMSAREVPRRTPPSRCMRDTSSIVISCCSSV